MKAHKLTIKKYNREDQVSYFANLGDALNTIEVKPRQVAVFVYSQFLRANHIPNQYDFEQDYYIETRPELLDAISEVFDLATVWAFCQNDEYDRHEFEQFTGAILEEIEIL